MSLRIAPVTTGTLNQADVAASLIEPSCSLAVLTGAGMSAESGIPTFRDALTGLWAKFAPEELASPQAFGRDPERVFRWYFERWRAARDVEPHSGHLALSTLQALVETLTVVTQNVDGLHQRAGVEDVIELHGALAAFRCWDRGHPFAIEAWSRDGDARVMPPRCDECSSVVRPGVVWFGEMLPVDAVARATRMVTTCDVLLVVGTSARVYPAADYPLLAQAAGARVIEINPEPTVLSTRVDVSWMERAGVALPALATAVSERRS